MAHSARMKMIQARHTQPRMMRMRRWKGIRTPDQRPGPPRPELPYFLRILSMSAGDSIHSSEYPQCEQRKRVTGTCEKIVMPVETLLPEPYAPVVPGIRITSRDSHFGHVPVVFNATLVL